MVKLLILYEMVVHAAIMSRLMAQVDGLAKRYIE